MSAPGDELSHADHRLESPPRGILSDPRMAADRKAARESAESLKLPLEPSAERAMSGKLERYKSDEEMTVGDLVHFQRTGERPERDEYRQARREALEAAGLEVDDGGGPPAELEDMNVDDHARRIYSDR